MIVAFPLLLIAAIVIARRRSGSRGGAGGRWFAAWAAAGAAMTFSFLTGLSIGLFVLPFAAGLLLWVARRAPHLPEALGFLAGIGAVSLLVAFLNRAGNGVDPLPWLLAGVSLTLAALLAHTLLRHRDVAAARPDAYRSSSPRTRRKR